MVISFANTSFVSEKWGDRQGCIKLGLVRAGAGVREVSPFLSGAQSNPAGLAAGSRWSFRGRRGNDHRIREAMMFAQAEGWLKSVASAVPAGLGAL